MNPERYFQYVRSTDDPYVLKAYETVVGGKLSRTVVTEPLDDIVQAMRRHFRGVVKHGNSMTVSRNTDFAILDIDVKRKESDSTWTVDESLRSKLWLILDSRIRAMVGASASVFESASGGAHVYVHTDRVDCGTAFTLAERMARLFREDGFHVDVYPSVSGTRRIFWEYFAGKNNLKWSAERSLSREDVESVIRALSGRVGDTSRSGMDFRWSMRSASDVFSEFLAWRMKQLPWNEGREREITPQYARRTFEKASGVEVWPSEVVDISSVPSESFMEVFCISGVPVYKKEFVVIHGAPGVGKTTLALKSVPEGALYISTEFDRYVARKYVERWRPDLLRPGGLYFAFEIDPAKIAATIVSGDYSSVVIDSFQYLVFEDFRKGGEFIRFLRNFASVSGTPVVVVSHDNRRDGNGLERLHTYSQLGHLATKVVWVLNNGLMVQKNSFAGLAQSGKEPPSGFTPCNGESSHSGSDKSSSEKTNLCSSYKDRGDGSESLDSSNVSPDDRGERLKSQGASSGSIPFLGETVTVKGSGKSTGNVTPEGKDSSFVSPSHNCRAPP